MKVVVVGASGNVGTALLRRLADDPVVLSVVGVARRVPGATPAPPYDVADWVRADIGATGPDEPVIEHLAEVFAGADAVVHLAWLIQPSHRRSVLRRVNVDGTRRVVEAAVRAGVPHLVVASSVGAYSPGRGDDPRREDWPTAGVPSSSYSVDKVAVEAILDDIEARYPQFAVARLRPALVFQRDAGHELKGYFLGPFVPAPLLDGRLPVLPWPRGLRLQAVHADDLASAYREAVVRQARGAFNIAAPDVIRAPQVADLVAGGSWREVPVGLARAAVSVGWHTRVVPVGPGWLDMAAQAPVLDIGRAERELGFAPRFSGAQALAEAVEGIAQGSGALSPPMRPRLDRR